MIDRLVSTSNNGDWKLTTFGHRIENSNTYAGALVSPHFLWKSTYLISRLLAVDRLEATAGLRRRD